MAQLTGDSQEKLIAELNGDSIFLSGVSEGKMRIYEQFQKPSTPKERISFLKNEYGWGGYGPVIAGTGINESHSGKGIELSRGYRRQRKRLHHASQNARTGLAEIHQRTIYT